MDEKRYIFETVEITDCDTDVSRIAKVITDTKETYSYEDLDEIVDKLNEQQDTINILLDLLYQSEETVINEYSSHIGEDMDKLDKIFKEKDIKEIERFVRGCDDE